MLTRNSTELTDPGVVPSLADRWSHHTGGTHLKVVPCHWRATLHEPTRRTKDGCDSLHDATSLPDERNDFGCGLRGCSTKTATRYRSAGTTPKRHGAHGNRGSCNCEQRVSRGQTYEPERAAQPLTKRRAGSVFTWPAGHQSKWRNCDLASKLSEAQLCGSAQRLTRTVSEPYIG